MTDLTIFLKRLLLRWRDLQRVIRFFIQDSFLFLFPVVTVPRTLLIVRLEGIGDYLLFRNFILEIFKSNKYSDYKITLCGSNAFKDLALKYDSELLSDHVWISTGKLKSKSIYRWKTLKHIRSKGFDTVLYPTYSRESITGDSIVRIAGARESVGTTGDYVHAKPWERTLYNRYYTSLIEISDETTFEFYKNKEFIENLLAHKVDTIRPSLNFQPSPTNKIQYVVVCPGSLLRKKRWPFERFIHAMDYLHHNYGITGILVGDKNDIPSADHQQFLLQRSYIQNLIGTLSLDKTAQIIQDAVLVLTNDTSVSHIGVALGKPVVIISNGEHYGRFSEYPKEIHSQVFYAYPPEIIHSKESFHELVKNYTYGSQLDITSISIDQVLTLVNKALLQNDRGIA